MLKLNREAWNSEVQKGNTWTRPVSPEVIADARMGKWSLLLTPTKPAPAEWYPELRGASIAAFNFADGKQFGTTATTDQQGRYTISNIPKGIDVVIKATAGAGSRNGAGMRLSTLVLGAADGADGNIDGATSLGAEAWGRHYGTGHNVAAWDFQMTLDAR